MQTEWRAKQKIIFLLSILRCSLCSARLKIMHVLLSEAKKPSGEQSKNRFFIFKNVIKNPSVKVIICNFSYIFADGNINA